MDTFRQTGTENFVTGRLSLKGLPKCVLSKEEIEPRKAWNRKVDW